MVEPRDCSYCIHVPCAVHRGATCAQTRALRALRRRVSLWDRKGTTASVCIDSATDHHLLPEHIELLLVHPQLERVASRTVLRHFAIAGFGERGSSLQGGMSEATGADRS